ncbi:phosphoserine phosphatase SerB [Psittacicella hinzii]|uniref:Phosphoserine phosphatase n=1 Tax=Psittacicella hinzii TaxID=2028575 RepID=A0A3A1Y1P4_9GAMM|nr:phosphoserine phosphatase SerB [Psittacicella hinzii]RIY31340.1 phosphoserine phosphatase SerB [Psittacicella hinzii]
MVKLATLDLAQRTRMRQTAAALSAFPANNLSSLAYKALLTRDPEAYAAALEALPVNDKTEKELAQLKDQERELIWRQAREKEILENERMTLVGAVFTDFPIAKLLNNLCDYNTSIHVVKIYHEVIVVVMSTDKPEQFLQYLRDNGADSVNLSLVPLISDKGAFVSDMDSTMVTCECIDKIASLCGIEDEVAAITEQAMQGKLDFAASLQKRVALLQGVAVADFKNLIANLPVTPGADLLLKYLGDKGWQSALVSGGFVPFAQAVAKALGFNTIHANVLGEENGILTGKVEGEIVDAPYKAKVVASYQEQGLTTIAIGDGANDIEMLKASNFAVAYHAKPVVDEHADFIIKQNDLRALLAILEMRAWLN